MVKLFLILLVACFSLSKAGQLNKQDVKEDDFDEFEFDFEEDNSEDDNEDGDGVNEEDGQEGEFDSEEDDDNDDDEFDSEEFEGESSDSQASSTGTDNLEIVESTVEIKPFWEAYFVEICIVLMAALYFTNYLLGRTKNTTIAESWVKDNLKILQNNFELVGDDGEGEEPSESHLVRRSDNSFIFWCSGRVNCDGLLVHLELTKRHDLISIIHGMFKPSPDTISFIFQLSDNDMDSIVCAIASKKTITKIQKDYEDLSNFCAPPRSADKHGLPNSFSVLSETFDTASAVLSGSMNTFLSKNSDIFISLHVSDQYTGIKEGDSEDSDTVVIKKSEKRIHLTFKIPPSSSENQTDLLLFALRFLDHIKGVKLSKEAKDKTSKNRQKVVQNQEKLQHQARQEAAQQRREDKRKADKEKLLQETDPEKARKLEEKEHKKQMKKSTSRMKQMKVRMG